MYHHSYFQWWFFRGNQCINCSQPFVHSWVSFEILPLVEFQLEEGISDVEAMRLIESDSGTTDTKHWEDGGDDNVLTLGDDASEDPFTTRLYSFQHDGGSFTPVIASRNVLRSLGPGEVIVCRWPPPLRNTYFRNLMPDMSITKCQTCNKVLFQDFVNHHIDNHILLGVSFRWLWTAVASKGSLSFLQVTFITFSM